MSKADAIKERLAFIRLGLIAFLGFFFVIFWSIYQDESLVNNMSEEWRLKVVFVVLVLAGALLNLLMDYAKKVRQLEKEP